jgi:hypothetical protein
VSPFAFPSAEWFASMTKDAGDVRSAGISARIPDAGFSIENGVEPLFISSELRPAGESREAARCIAEPSGTLLFRVSRRVYSRPELNASPEFGAGDARAFASSVDFLVGTGRTKPREGEEKNV